MQQTAQVTRILSEGRAEVKVHRTSACASAHNCGSCDHCSLMENAPEVGVEADNLCGARAGDTVTVESATSRVLGAAVLVYIVPFALFFGGYLCGGAFHYPESISIALGGVGFAAGLAAALGLDRYYRRHRAMSFKIVSVKL